MNIIHEEPKAWNEIVKDALCHCRHILELDFLRDDVVHKNDHDEPVYAYVYSIKEIPTKVNTEKIGKLSHLLFYEYKENPNYIQEQPSVIFNCSIINVVKTELLVPKVFNSESYQELSVLMSVEDALSCMKRNVRLMISNKMKDLRKNIIMVHIYVGILNELGSTMMNTNEMSVVNNLQREIDVILQFYQNELRTLKLESENIMMKDFKLEQERTSRLLDRIDCIVINTEENIEQFLEGYSVSQLNGKTIIKSPTANALLELYSKLTHLNYDVKLRINEDIEVGVKKGENYVVSGNSSTWAFVFYRLYGEKAKYTVERDNEVEKVIKLYEKLKIPIDYMISQKND